MVTKKTIALSLSLLIICLLLQSCKKATNSTWSSTSTPSPSSTLALVETLFTTATPSLPAIASLDPGLSELEIRRLMATNDRCAGFCFWGVTSGSTPFRDAWNIFSKFKALSLRQDKFGNLEFVDELRASEGRIYIGFDFIERNNKAEIKSVTIDGIGRTDVSGEEWSAFRIDNYLLSSGAPNDFRIIMSEGPEGQISYELIIVYSQSFIVYYGNQGAKEPEKIHACPYQDQSFDRFDLTSKEYGNENLDLHNSITQSELTGMSNIEFYKALIEKSTQFCFNLDYEKYFRLAYDK